MMDAYMRDIVTLRIAQTDKWGTRRYRERKVRARIDEGTRTVRDFSGEQVVSSAKIYIKRTALTEDDKIHYSGVDHIILRLDGVKDFHDKYMVVSVS